MFVERTLDTEVGPAQIAITRGNHVSMQGQPVIRDSKFNAHFHFFATADGSFDLREEDRPSMSRAWKEHDRNLRFHESAPKTYLAKVIAAYKTALNNFLASNPDLLVQAENDDIEREIGSAEAAVNKAQEELNTAKAALDALYLKRRKQYLNSARPTTPA
jgi:hypothetical protein